MSFLNKWKLVTFCILVGVFMSPLVDFSNTNLEAERNSDATIEIEVKDSINFLDDDEDITIEEVTEKDIYFPDELVRVVDGKIELKNDEDKNKIVRFGLNSNIDNENNDALIYLYADNYIDSMNNFSDSLGTEFDENGVIHYEDNYDYENFEVIEEEETQDKDYPNDPRMRNITYPGNYAPMPDVYLPTIEALLAIFSKYALKITAIALWSYFTIEIWNELYDMLHASIYFMNGEKNKKLSTRFSLNSINVSLGAVETYFVYMLKTSINLFLSIQGFLSAAYGVKGQIVSVAIAVIKEIWKFVGNKLLPGGSIRNPWSDLSRSMGSGFRYEFKITWHWFKPKFSENHYIGV